MNGFEPLRRRIIDYTETGQWSEVYDGPLEDCESEKLKAENDQLVMKLNAEHIVRQNVDVENDRLRELVRLMVRRYTPISPCKNIPCGECPVKDECDQEDALMCELGIEVDG